MYEFLVPPWRALVLDVTVKGFVLLLAAGIAAACLRRASASSRHLVWLLTFGGLLSLPLLSAALPGWRLSIVPPVLPAPQAAALLSGAAAWHFAAQAPARLSPSERHPGSPLAGARTRISFSGIRAGASGSGSGLASALRQSRDTHASVLLPFSPRRLAKSGEHGASTPPAWPALPWDFILWLGVAAIVVARFLGGLVQLGRISQRCRRVTAAPVVALATQLARDLDLPRPVTLLHGLLDGPPAVPMTWGFLRPIVLLPTGFAGWPEERQRAVLLHELAHVKRGDWLVQLLARVACALYWFHPLVWWAARRLRTESEQACDDRVLTAGIKASDYATHLLEVVRATRVARGSLRAAVSMARGPLIELRLRAILDARRSRQATPRRASLTACAAAVGILPLLAAVRVSARIPSAPPAALPAATTAPAMWSSSADRARVEIRDVTTPHAGPNAPAMTPPAAEPGAPAPAQQPAPSPSPKPAPAPAPAPKPAPAPATAPSSPGATLPQTPEESPDHAAGKGAGRESWVAFTWQGRGGDRSIFQRVVRAVADYTTAARVVEAAAEAEASDARPREPNLSDKDLSGADLSGRDLSGKDLSGKDLSGANLSGAKLRDANLSGTDLSGANLANADLSHAKMKHADLSGSNLTGARLSGVDLTGVDLSGANLSHVEAADLTLAHADLSGCNLKGINLAGMDLSGADFSGTDLAGAKLSGANLTKSDLSGANLGDADLSHARLTNADLSGANLNGTRLEGADLNGADVSGTKLDKSKPE